MIYTFRKRFFIILKYENILNNIDEILLPHKVQYNFITIKNNNVTNESK